MQSRPFRRHQLGFDLLCILDTYLGRPAVNRVLRRYRTRNLRHLLERGEQLGEPQQIDAVTSHADLSPTAFKSDYLGPGKPVVLRGMAKDWKAVAEWSPEFFAERFGDEAVLTVDGLTRPVVNHEAGIGAIGTRTMTIREQVDAMQRGDPDYISFWSTLFSDHPELADALDIPELTRFVEPSWWSPNPVFKFFMGAGGTSTPWHCAELQNLFVQIHGNKEWMLAAPEYSPCLDPRIASLSQQYTTSMIDFRDPDLGRYPLYRYLRIERVVLEPGDVLYVPPFYWHCVSNPELSIGLALWWYNLLPAMKANPTLFWLTVLSPQHVIRKGSEMLRGHDQQAATTAATIFREHRN